MEISGFQTAIIWPVMIFEEVHRLWLMNTFSKKIQVDQFYFISVEKFMIMSSLQHLNRMSSLHNDGHLIWTSDSEGANNERANNIDPIGFGSLNEGDQMNIYHDESPITINSVCALEAWNFIAFPFCFEIVSIWLNVLSIDIIYNEESDYHHDHCYLNDTL